MSAKPFFPLSEKEAMDTLPFIDEESLYKWEFRNKGYPHFDTPYPEKRVNALLEAIDQTQNVSHSFYPLIKFKLPKYKRCPETKRIFEDTENPRPIMHTARIDANIYSFFRNKLMNDYDEFLHKNGIEDVVIAYRKIAVSKKGDRNKCNVHFANEAIDEIIDRCSSNQAGCAAIALDIKGFFENLDHGLIRESWCKIIGSETGLPPDHWTIYKNITRFKYIDAEEVEKRLGIDFKKLSKENRHRLSMRKKGAQALPPDLQLCLPEVFKEKIVPYLANENTKGIPQGTTISDVIANMYMYRFDILMKRYATKNDGYYRRYSDDILFICPIALQQQAQTFICKLIKRLGKTISISETKTLMSHFQKSGDEITCTTFNHSGQIGKPFEYLGLSFDGRKKRIRQSTISGFYDKLNARILKEAHIAHGKLLRKGNPLPSAREVYKMISFDMIRNSYMQDRTEYDEDDLHGNFYTYVRLVAEVTGSSQVMDIFNGLGQWMKKRAEQHCKKVCRKHQRKLSKKPDKQTPSKQLTTSAS